jgi:hypothetical protein
MSLNYTSGPVIHVGVSATLALVFRLNPVVAVFCGILPDLVDKPLAAFGIGGGRYIGHTLLFVAVIVTAFFLWRRKYGLAALTGLTSHLLLDLNTLVPWFYPFKSYNFSNTKFDLVGWLKSYLTFSESGWELIIVVVAALAPFIYWWLYRRDVRRQKRKD